MIFPSLREAMRGTLACVAIHAGEPCGGALRGTLAAGRDFPDAGKVTKGAPKGTYSEAVPFGNPPRRPRGLRPHWIP